jgi:hypothetical protein
MARGILDGSLIVKTAGSIRERLARRQVRIHSHVGKAQGYLWSYLTRSLALARDSLQGAPMKSRGSLHASRYLGKNTRVVDGSLHLSTLLFSFRIYIAIFILCFTFLG